MDTSLSVEAFFYGLFPLLLLMLRKLGSHTATILLVGVGGGIVLWDALIHPSQQTGTAFWAIYELPPVRLAEFAIGILVALLLRRDALPAFPLRPALVLALAGWLLAGRASTWALPVSVTVAPFVFLIIAAAQSDLAGSRTWLRSPLLLKLGEWSYCFYPTHQLAFRLVHGAHLSLPDLVGWIASLALALVSAALLCELVERPLERRLRGDGRLPVTLTSAAHASTGTSASVSS
jgi:peptidoglycan/LPS O-acetylase OafA/YrhL